MPISKTLTIVRGKTLQLILRYGSEPLVAKAISAISIQDGFPRLTVNGHGLVNGWKSAVTRVQGMKQINALNNPPDDTSDYRETLVIDANTIEYNGLVPVDDSGKEWPAYTGGGFIQYYTPVNLANKRVDVVIKDKKGGTILLSSRASDAPLNLIAATVDNTAKTISIRIDADDTAALAWKKGIWEAEVHDTVTGAVDALVVPSIVVVEDEVAS